MDKETNVKEMDFMYDQRLFQRLTQEFSSGRTQYSTFKNPHKVEKVTDCCKKTTEVSLLFQVKKCNHFLCRDCIQSPIRKSAVVCTSDDCNQSIREDDLVKFLKDLDFEHHLKCDNCKSNESIKIIKYNVRCKPNPNELIVECEKCISVKEQEKNKNVCPRCKQNDLSIIGQARYKQCTNCQFLQCTKCNLIIDRQYKKQSAESDYKCCNCRCLACLELIKNQSQDQPLQPQLFCKLCDLTCQVCRLQRKLDNIHLCKDCQFCITTIKSVNSQYLQKCSHFREHLEIMNKGTPPKLNIQIFK